MVIGIFFFSQILSRQCCLWKPVKIVGLIVLENPPAVGKRVIANIGRLSSPDTSVHLQVPSLAKDQVSQVILPSEPSEPSEISKLLKVINYQAWGSPNIDRCLEALLCWRIGKFSRVINHELVRAAKMAITFLISSLNEISFRTCRCCPHPDFPGSCTHSLHKRGHLSLLWNTTSLITFVNYNKYNTFKHLNFRLCCSSML